MVDSANLLYTVDIVNRIFYYLPIMSESVKTRLLKTGLKYLQNHNTEELSLRKIAQLCKLSHNAPYKHFKSKDEFLKALFHLILSEFQNNMSFNTNNMSQSEVLKEWARRYIQFFSENESYFHHFFGSSYTAQISFFKNRIEPGTGTFVSNIEKHIKVLAEKNIKNNAGSSINTLLLWSAVHGYTSLLVSKKIRVPDPAATEAFLDQMLNLF